MSRCKKRWGKEPASDLWWSGGIKEEGTTVILDCTGLVLGVWVGLVGWFGWSADDFWVDWWGISGQRVLGIDRRQA